MKLVEVFEMGGIKEIIGEISLHFFFHHWITTSERSAV